MPTALIIADDMTGAADTGVQFASRGWRTLLALEQAGIGGADVLALSSDSRSLKSGPAAAAAVMHALQAGQVRPSRLIYKKIDSTLRGQVAAELHAAMSALGESRALVAPAFPAQGRTTRGGVQHLHGRPLDQTEYASQIPTAHLPSLLGAGAALLPLEIVREGEVATGAALRSLPGVVVCDAETEADLLILARAGLAEGLRLYCGAAGLAAALVESLAPPYTQALQFTPRMGPVLVVVGARQTVQQDQIAAVTNLERLSEIFNRPVPVIEPPAEFYRDATDVGVAETAAALAAALDAGAPVVLSNLGAPPGRMEPGESRDPLVQRNPVAAKLARAARLALQAANPAGLVVIGDDTAAAVLATLGCRRIWLGGQLEAGIPWGFLADGAFPGLPVLINSGNFGSSELLSKALLFLAGG